MSTKTQQEISEILFHFHLDQAAANLQVMRDTIGYSRESLQDFKAAARIIDRLWAKQQRIILPKWGEFEDLSIALGECMQIFLKAKDYNGLLEVMKQHKP